MTTENHVMAILERANPVPPGELVDVPVGATRYLGTALEQRSEPMTVIDPTPTGDADQPSRRRWPLIAAAASVVAIVVASIALIVATRDDSTVVDQPEPIVPATAAEAVAETTSEPDDPAPTTTAAPDLGAARAVVDEFVAANNAGDTDAVMALLADGFEVSEVYGGLAPRSSGPGTTDQNEIETRFAWNHSQGEQWADPACTLAGLQRAGGTTLSCEWNTLDAVVQAVDGQPIPSTALVVVGDAGIVELHLAYAKPDFTTLGAPFKRWLDEYHPDVEGADCCAEGTREESERRGRLRAQWSHEWATWLGQWNCDGTSCSSSPEEWAAEYSKLCVTLDPPELPTAEFVERVQLIPRPTFGDDAVDGILGADAELADDGLGGARVDELQQLRLDAMIELGIEERCHQAVE